MIISVEECTLLMISSLRSEGGWMGALGVEKCLVHDKIGTTTSRPERVVLSGVGGKSEHRKLSFREAVEKEGMQLK